MGFIESWLTGIATDLSQIAPTLSLILILLAGIVYGLAQAQPPESRGKWISWATNLFIGAVILAAITGAAILIRDTASLALT